MATRKFTALTRAQYYTQLAQKINTTVRGDRVRVISMGFRPEKPDIHPILDALNNAATRGVDVHLIIDAMSFLMTDRHIPGPLFAVKKLPRRLPPPFSTRMRTLETLKQNGGKYTITNFPKRIFQNPTSGRSHLKLALINDEIFTGGCNLTQLHHLDLMVYWRDKPSAEWLNKLVDSIIAKQNVAEALRYKDQSFTIDDETTLLVDCGVPGQSIIFDSALELIDTAEKQILITCQYFPNGQIATRLQAAHERGVEVKVIFNHPSIHYFPVNLGMHSTVRSEKRRLSPELFAHVLPKGHRYLHSKLLATDKGTIIGSHNFVPAGVRFGTAEIAVLSKNKAFPKQFIKILV